LSMLEQAPTPDQRSLGELLGELSRGLSTLMRQEIELAKTEITGMLERAGKSGGMVAAGGALLHAGGLAIIAGIILALGNLMPLWLSALLIGGLITAAGYGLVRTNLRELKRIDPTPRQTIQTLKEDASWMKERVQ
jgi:hypothetical protein